MDTPRKSLSGAAQAQLCALDQSRATGWKRPFEGRFQGMMHGKKASRAALLAVAALSLGACAALEKVNPVNWFASSAVKPNELVTFTPTLTVREQWRMSIGSGAGFAFSPRVVGANVYLASNDGSVAKHDTSTGGQVWRVKLDKRLSAGVGSDGNLVVVGTPKGEVIALDSNGKEKWVAQTSSEILSAPFVMDDTVIVRSNDNRIWAFDGTDGKRRWLYQRPAPSLTLRIAPGMAGDRGTVFVGVPGGKLVALNVNTGAVRWEGTVNSPRGATELERVADVTSAPILIDRDVCAAAFQGRVSCFDSLNGTNIWGRDISVASGIGADGRYVFATDERSAVVALARSSGGNLWRQDKMAHRRLTAPASMGRAAAMGDYQGFVHYLSREDGAMLARVATDGSPMLVGPVAAGNSLIVQTANGTVLSLANE
jgi:outer membrane protein assembly factor BamB